MAIANPILTTAVTLGATVTSLAKVSEGHYTYVNPTGQVPTTLTIKQAAPGSGKLNIVVTLKRNPGILDVSPDQRSGIMSATFQLNGTLGTAVTRDTLQDFAVELGSLISTPSLIDALLAGSLV